MHPSHFFLLGPYHPTSSQFLSTVVPGVPAMPSTIQATTPMNIDQVPLPQCSHGLKSVSHTPQQESDPTLSTKDPQSSLGSETEESDGSGPDYYTSDSEDDEDPHFEYRLSEKQRAKRNRLKAERDAIKPSYYYGEKEAEEEALRKGASKPHLKRKGLRGVPVFEPR